MKNNFSTLWREAYAVSKERKLGRSGSYGGVGSALITRKGNIYTGTCIDVDCSLGFCAEHSAIAEMLKHGESAIKEIIAVTNQKKILPPCGRCRELIYQVDSTNKNTLVHLSENTQKKLRALLPDHWRG